MSLKSIATEGFLTGPGSVSLVATQGFLDYVIITPDILYVITFELRVKLVLEKYLEY